ncbi:hypothetical protein EIZ94_11105 [Escherichia coli]|uniref:Na+/H+ antiporter NhaA n=1 Tax=Escherichia coli TaxID=562 RepID=UPI00128E9C21|nr:hypothetical protein [Escherichia coli]HAP3149039.1 Na+/H+ antiporter NhaA [Escherichia coli]HAW2773036.1 Na+/H+ antiporter NhaA [Escherichia coli]
MHYKDKHALAIIDDLAVIIIIALFYTQKLNLVYLFGALVTLTLLLYLNFKNNQKSHWYILLGLRTYPKRILFQTMMAQARCSIAS